MTPIFPTPGQSYEWLSRFMDHAAYVFESLY